MSTTARPRGSRGSRTRRASVTPTADPAIAAFYYVHSDGRDITVRIERRPNGRYALDLRHPLKGGRVAIKKPGTNQGVKTVHEATKYASNILRPIFDATPSGALPPVRKASGWRDTVKLHLEAMAVERYGDKTLIQAEYAITRLLGIAYHELGLRQLDQIRPIHITHMVASMKKVVYRGKPLSNRYIRQQFMYLGGLYSWAVENEMVGHNPVSRHSGIPKIPKGSNRAWLEPSQAQAMLDEAQSSAHHHSPQLFYIMAAQLYTGMTPKECLGLMVSDIHWDIAKIEVRAHAHRRLKNDHRARWVPLPPRLAQYLRKHLSKNQVATDGLLFPKPGIRQRSGAAREEGTSVQEPWPSPSGPASASRSRRTSSATRSAACVSACSKCCGTARRCRSSPERWPQRWGTAV